MPNLSTKLLTIFSASLLGLFFLGSCQDSSTDPPAVSEGGSAVTTNSESRTSHEGSSSKFSDEPLPTMPGLGEHRFDNVVRSVAEREDPVKDGWDTERFNEIAGAQLKVVGKLLTHPEDLNQTNVSAVVNEEYRGEAIRPAGLEVAFRDKSTTVSRMKTVGDEGGKDGSVESVSGFMKALGEISDLLDGLEDKRFKFKIVRVIPQSDGTATVAYFQISGRNGGKAVQVNSTWHSVWDSTPPTDGGPKLKSNRIENYEEIVYSSPGGSMFSDCTKSVFAKTDLFERQLLQGLDYWTDRFDGAIARPAAGHGIAVGDVNGDGLDDLYLSQSPGLPNLLLVQNADGTVEDTAVEAGVHWLEGTRAALLSDLDNDGDQDLVAVLGGKVVIQENDGKGKFELRSIVSAVSSLFAINAIDYDNDGDLDLYICGYTLGTGKNLDDVFANPMPFEDANNGGPNVLLRNDGGWNFEDVTNEVGLGQNNSKFSYASTWDDYDGDGDLDVYVANDFGRNNLYRNDDGKFVDVAGEADIEDIGPGMSAAWGDFNNDGQPDLYVSNMFSSAGNRITTQQKFKAGIDGEKKKVFVRHARGNSLFQNAGNGSFVDRSVDLGVTLGRWAWGSLFVDFNNDGWEDLYVANGFITADNNNDL